MASKMINTIDVHMKNVFNFFIVNSSLLQLAFNLFFLLTNSTKWPDCNIGAIPCEAIAPDCERLDI